MADKTPDAAAPKQVIVPVKWPAVGAATYANNLVAQFDGDSMRLVFTQVAPPYFTGEGPEKQQHLDSLEYVDAIKVAELAVPLERFRVMLKVLQEHLSQVENRANK